eukprot:1122519-Pleurochrysis_carterae.AAC.1
MPMLMLMPMPMLMLVPMLMTMPMPIADADADADSDADAADANAAPQLCESAAGGAPATGRSARRARGADEARRAPQGRRWTEARPLSTCADVLFSLLWLRSGRAEQRGCDADDGGGAGINDDGSSSNVGAGDGSAVLGR